MCDPAVQWLEDLYDDLADHPASADDRWKQRMRAEGLLVDDRTGGELANQQSRTA